MSFRGPAEGTELPSRSRFCAKPERDAYLVVARLAFDRSPVSVARNIAQAGMVVRLILGRLSPVRRAAR